MVPRQTDPGPCGVPLWFLTGRRGKHLTGPVTHAAGIGRLARRIELGTQGTRRPVQRYLAVHVRDVVRAKPCPLIATRTGRRMVIIVA